MEAKTMKQERMDSSQLMSTLESAIKVWKSEQGLDDTTTPPPKASRESSRENVLAAAKSLVLALQGPRNIVVELSKAPAGHAALRTALMLDVFNDWASDEVKTADELAGQTGAENLLILRIMRTLVGMGIFEERAEATYGHSTLSWELVDPSFRTMVTGMASTAGLTMAKLPEFLASIEFQSPKDPKNALFQYALDTELNMFQWLEQHPKHLAAFSAFQAASTKRRAPVIQATLHRLLTNTEPFISADGIQTEEHQVLLVDVGAGRGRLLGAIRKNKSFIGRIIAQDLPEVIAGRESVDGVENMAFDFLQAQPVKGASIYFFSHIFHDWPDDTCHHILANTLPALTANYSRVVIVDQVLPNVSAPSISSLLDISMMTFGGRERTDREWRSLLESAGLSVLSIEQSKTGVPGSDGLIIALLRQ